MPWHNGTMASPRLDIEWIEKAAVCDEIVNAVMRRRRLEELYSGNNFNVFNAFLCIEPVENMVRIWSAFCHL